MSNITPDSWIERNPLDEGPPMTDAEMCEEGYCEHEGHCDVCGKGTYGDEARDGVCVACEIKRLRRNNITNQATIKTR